MALLRMVSIILRVLWAWLVGMEAAEVVVGRLEEGERVSCFVVGGVRGKQLITTISARMLASAAPGRKVAGPRGSVGCSPTS